MRDDYINKICFFCHQVIEEAKYLKSTASQRTQEIDSLRSELDEAILLEGQQKAALDDQSHLAVTTICTADRTRQSAAQLAYDEEQQLISVSGLPLGVQHMLQIYFLQTRMQIFVRLSIEVKFKLHVRFFVDNVAN